MKRISYITDSFDNCVDITVPRLMVPEFMQMVQRATSTWQDMSPDMRDFADRVLGREDVMGTNMKEGAEQSWNIPHVSPVVAAAVELATKQLATRSCCHTLLCEPHLSVCPHISGVPHTPRSVCNNHPETCNCPVHCK